MYNFTLSTLPLKIVMSSSDIQQLSSEIDLESIESLNLLPVTEDTESRVPLRLELYLVMVYLSCLSLIGTAGNALVLYVFSKKKDTLVSTQCIIALATVDFMTCLLVIPFTIYMEYTEFHIGNDFCCKLYQFLITSSIPFSALVMVAIALDRYFCICHPFLRLLTVGRSKVMICFLWLIAGTLGVCVALMYSVYRRLDEPVRENSSTEYYNSLWNNFTLDQYNQTVLVLPINQNIITDYESFERSGGDIGLHVTTDFDNSLINSEVIVNTGKCDQVDLILSQEFQFYYQKLYNTIFPVCLFIVAILYVIIYRSVLVRRNKRQKQKSTALLLVKSANKTPSPNNIKKSATLEQLVAINGGGVSNRTTETSSGSATTHVTLNVKPFAPPETAVGNAGEKRPPGNSNGNKKEPKNRMANMKTGAMLFVVNVVFFVTFLPAYLMVLQVLPENMATFYLYFANNVANPVIYSFMNKNFRSDLAKIFT